MVLLESFGASEAPGGYMVIIRANLGDFIAFQFYFQAA
jgi:hypothetical protein